jgi:hypothetical protein
MSENLGWLIFIEHEILYAVTGAILREKFHFQVGG